MLRGSAAQNVAKCTEDFSDNGQMEGEDIGNAPLCFIHKPPRACVCVCIMMIPATREML